MSRLKPILALMAGVAAGLVLSLYFSKPEPAPTPTAPTVASDRADAPTPPAAAPGQPAPTPQQTEWPLPEPAPPGSGVIEGVILLADGRPLQGVLVAASPMARFAGARETVEEFAQRRATERALRPATTDASGHYRIQGLDESGFYAVQPSLAGFRFRSDRPEGVRHFRCGTVNFTASAAVPVTLKLSMPDGSAPADAEVEIAGEGGGRRSVWNWRATAPERDFPPGHWHLSVRRAAGINVRGQATVAAGAEGTPVFARIHLKAPVNVEGTVGSHEGMHECIVELAPTRTGSIVPWCMVTAEQSWRFCFEDVAPGNYEVRVRADGRTLVKQPITVAGRTLSLHIPLPEPEAKDHIVIRVFGPAGPVEDAVSVVMEFKVGTATFGGTEYPLRRGDGEYWIPRNAAFLPSADDSYQVTVAVHGLGSRVLQYGRDDAHVLEVRFDQAAYLTVEVAGLDEHPQREALIVKLLRRNLNGQIDNDWSRESRESVPRFGPLTPGRYVVWVELDRQVVGTSSVLASREVAMEATDQTVRLNAPVLYSLTLAVPERLRSGELSLKSTGHELLRHLSRVGPDGQMEVRNLPAGEYLLQMASVGVMKISMPSDNGRRIEFAPQPFNALRMRAYAPMAVDVGIKPGDYVIEIDGEAMDDDPPRQALVSEAASKVSTTWIIMRNGTRISVTFDGRDWPRSGLTGESVRVD